MEDISGIYKIICLKNNKVYIGSSVNLRKRKISHLHELRLNKHSNKRLQNAYNKYGEESFCFEKVLECSPEELLFFEEQMIKQYDSFKQGFNLVEKPTQNMLGYKHTIEAKNKMSVASKNRGRNSGKLTKEQVTEIRQKFFDGERITNLAEQYRLDRNSTRKCVYLLSYMDVPCEIEGYDKLLENLKKDRENGIRTRSRGWNHSEEFKEKFKKAVSKPSSRRLLTPEQIRSIRKRAKNGETYKILSKEFGVNENSISRIVRKIIYYDID